MEIQYEELKSVPEWYKSMGFELSWLDEAYYVLTFSNWPGIERIKNAFQKGGWARQPISLHEAISMACIEQDREYRNPDGTRKAE